MELTITNLNKRYNKKQQALKDINLTLTNGTFGLLGPNGAGKSSLMRTIATLQKSTSGIIKYEDQDIFTDVIKYKSKLGYLPQEFGVYDNMTGYQTLDYFAQLSGYNNKANRHDVISTLLSQVNLDLDAKKLVKNYSGGMKQRIGIAIALLNDPEILIVDEPTAGLDPQERIRFLNILTSVTKPRITILSTHIVADVSDLCDKIGILRSGELVYVATPSEAIDALKGKIYRGPVSEAIPIESTLLIQKSVDARNIQDIYTDSIAPEGYNPIEPNLEHVYFYHINKQLND
jgi:ABC-2 type transport system ATP-binding protein